MKYNSVVMPEGRGGGRWRWAKGERGGKSIITSTVKINFKKDKENLLAALSGLSRSLYRSPQPHRYSEHHCTHFE